MHQKQNARKTLRNVLINGLNCILTKQSVWLSGGLWPPDAIRYRTDHDEKATNHIRCSSNTYAISRNVAPSFAWRRPALATNRKARKELFLNRFLDMRRWFDICEHPWCGWWSAHQSPIVSSSSTIAQVATQFDAVIAIAENRPVLNCIDRVIRTSIA